jgi:hypothetical protein
MANAILKGSCICGAVTYEITGEPRAFYHCHCGRCRKSSGTGHASNVILKPETASWTSGEELLKSFAVPEAQRFRTQFCGTCGSPMPRIAQDLSIAVIPAGSLDTEPPLAPTDRIMWDSRTDWSCETGDLPAWPEYPE